MMKMMDSGLKFGRTWVDRIMGKVDKDQGVANAGKVLGIGNDGQVVPVEQSGGGSGSDVTTLHYGPVKTLLANGEKISLKFVTSSIGNAYIPYNANYYTVTEDAVNKTLTVNVLAPTQISASVQLTNGNGIEILPTADYTDYYEIALPQIPVVAMRLTLSDGSSVTAYFDAHFNDPRRVYFRLNKDGTLGGAGTDQIIIDNPRIDRIFSGDKRDWTVICPALTINLRMTAPSPVYALYTLG